MLIKIDDTVEVIVGDDSGKRGKVLSVNRDKDKVLVEHVNRVYKHVKRSQKNPQGGRLSKEMPVAVSNVLLVCPSCDKKTRVGARYQEDGSKERYCKKCGAGVGELSPPKAAYAKK